MLILIRLFLVLVAVMLKLLQPNWKIRLVEQHSRVAQEASNEWHNAGTGTLTCMIYIAKMILMFTFCNSKPNRIICSPAKSRRRP